MMALSETSKCGRVDSVLWRFVFWLLPCCPALPPPQPESHCFLPIALSIAISGVGVKDGERWVKLGDDVWVSDTLLGNKKEVKV